MKALALAVSLLGLSAVSAYAEDTAITIYSKAQPGAVDADTYRPINGQTGYMGANVPGYAVVREVRNVNLPQEHSVIKFSDVAALLDPTTVQFKSLTAPKSTKVAEQDYQFDLVSQQKLLEKYIDKKITVEKLSGDKTEQVEGTLLSTQGGITLKNDTGQISALNNYASIHFPELPGGLITKPTLVWSIFTDNPGMHKAEVSYETKGITWWADYNLIYHEGKDAGSGTVDFGSWVSIVNQTGGTYNNAKLKLIAGDVERVQSMRGAGFGGNMDANKPMAMAAAAPVFAEKTFFEYHLYTLDKSVNLPDNSTKQLELIPATSNIPVEKEFVYHAGEAEWNGGIYAQQDYGASEGNKKVEVFLKLKNKKENGLGVPLPAGRIRVNQRDDDGALEFIGENIIDHTPRNETVTIKLGNAFDVVGERRQVKFSTTAHTSQEEIELKIRNQKKQTVQVRVVENMYRAANWNISENNIDFNKDNAHQVSFLVNVEPEKEQIVTYTVHYNW